MQAIGDKMLRKFWKSFRAHPTGRKYPVSTGLRILSWQIRSRLNHGMKQNDWVEGSKLYARRGMTGATGNLYYGLHEHREMAFLLNFLRPDDHFLDVGANIGSYTILASAVCEAHTVAFEPDPETARILAGNIALNGIGDRVRVVEKACGETGGTVSFSVGMDTVNHVVREGEGQSRTVELTRLDDAVDHTPCLIKIDVEGYELNAIRGATRLLADPALLAILIETVELETEAILLANGFARHHYYAESKTVKNGPAPFPESNQLYLRDADAVRARVSSSRTYRVFGRPVQ